MANAAPISQLISSVYDAALDAGHWQRFMAHMASSLNAGFGLLWMQDLSIGASRFDDTGGNVSCTVGLDSVATSGYKNYYAGRNVWLPHAASVAEGSVAISSALYPDASLKQTEFHTDFLRPNDLFYAVGSSIVKRGPQDMKMSFLRSERAGRFSPEELHLVRQMLPHLRNAVVLHRKLFTLETLSAAATAALERVPAGVILLSDGCRLLHANRRAESLVRQTGSLRFGLNGEILATSSRDNDKLQALIQNAVRTGIGKGQGSGGSLCLSGPDGQQLQLLVVPLPLESRPLGPQASAAIFCSAPQQAVGILAESLHSLYRMTPAEARLADALVKGQSLQQYAFARGISVHTVRSQLKAAAAKTGARTQADLVRIVLSGLAIWVSPTPARAAGVIEPGSTPLQQRSEKRAA